MGEVESRQEIDCRIALLLQRAKPHVKEFQRVMVGDETALCSQSWPLSARKASASSLSVSRSASRCNSALRAVSRSRRCLSAARSAAADSITAAYIVVYSCAHTIERERRWAQCVSP